MPDKPPSNENPNGQKTPSTKPSAEAMTIREALRPLQVCCQNPKPPEALVIYAELLADIPPEQIHKAALRYLSENREPWFPSPGQLRALATEAAGGETPEWQNAWSRIMEAAGMWSHSDAEMAKKARAHVGEALYALMKSIIAPQAPFYDLMMADSAQLAVWESNFRNAYTNQRIRFDRNRALPEHLRPASANLEASSLRGRLPAPVKKHLADFGSVNREPQDKPLPVAAPMAVLPQGPSRETTEFQRLSPSEQAARLNEIFSAPARAAGEDRSENP